MSRTWVAKNRKDLGFDIQPDYISPFRQALLAQPCVEIRALKVGPEYSAALVTGRHVEGFASIVEAGLIPGRVPWPSPFAKDRLRVADLAAFLSRSAHACDPDLDRFLAFCQTGRDEESTVLWHRASDEVSKKVSGDLMQHIIFTTGPSFAQLLWNLMLSQEFQWLGPGFFPTLQFLLEQKKVFTDPEIEGKLISLDQTLVALEERMLVAEGFATGTGAILGMKQNRYRATGGKKRLSEYPWTLLRRRLMQKLESGTQPVFPVVFGSSGVEVMVRSQLLRQPPQDSTPHANAFSGTEPGYVVPALVFGTAPLVLKLRSLFHGEGFLKKLNRLWDIQESFLDARRRKKAPFAECGRFIETGNWRHSVENLLRAYRKVPPAGQMTDWMICALLMFFFDARFLVASGDELFPQMFSSFRGKCADWLDGVARRHRESAVKFVKWAYHPEPYVGWASQMVEDCTQDFLTREIERILQGSLEHAGEHASRAICRLGLGRISRFRMETIHRHSGRLFSALPATPLCVVREPWVVRRYYRALRDHARKELRIERRRSESDDTVIAEEIDPLSELDEILSTVGDKTHDWHDIVDDLDRVLVALPDLLRLRDHLDRQYPGGVATKVLRRWAELHQSDPQTIKARLEVLKDGKIDAGIGAQILKLLKRLNVDGDLRSMVKLRVRRGGKSE